MQKGTATGKCDCLWMFCIRGAKTTNTKKKKNQDFFFEEEEEEDIWIMHASQFCVYGEMQSL